MAGKSRGRGFAALQNSNTELRRPGEAGIRERLGDKKTPVSTKSEIQQDSEATKTKDFSEDATNNHGVAKVEKDEFADLCSNLSEMYMSSPKTTLEVIAKDMKLKCDSPDQLQICVDSLAYFALKSKLNAHAVAVFCEQYGDSIIAHQVSVRNLILKKLQSLYNERNNSYQDIDKFLLEATFACEIYHHVKIKGLCVKVLSRPIIDYLGMLLDGTSQKEIQVFVEQFPKCYKNLKECDPEGIEILLTKIRKGIVCGKTTVTAKAMLLENFELVLTDWKDLSHSAKTLYETFSMPVVRICE